MDRMDGKYTALHFAVKYFKPANVKLLVDNGASELICYHEHKAQKLLT